VRNLNNVEEGFGQQLAFREVAKKQAEEKPQKQGTEKEQKDTYSEEEAPRAGPHEQSTEKDFM